MDYNLARYNGIFAVKTFLTLTLASFLAVPGAYAFDRHNLDEALEMAELSARMNGRGQAGETHAPEKMDATCGFWELKSEGKSNDARKDFGFSSYANRWATYKSQNSTQPETYAIVIRGTITEPSSIFQDALAAPTSANRVYFADQKSGIKGAFLQLAEDKEADVHAGFAYGLIDILLHKEEDGAPSEQGATALLAYLRELPANATIYITGHSQGAAIATLLHAFLLQRDAPQNAIYGLAGKNFKIRSYVFAQPKPGDWRFAMDYSRALYKSKDGDFAYVVNNPNDWVPQVPLSHQWPSEAAGQMLISANANTTDKRWTSVPGAIVKLQNLARTAFSTFTAAVAVNAATFDGVTNLAEARKKLVQAKLRHASDGVFQGDLDGKLLEGMKPVETTDKIPIPGDSFSYMPMGQLVSLPLAEPTPNSGANVDPMLNHHMWLYLQQLALMKNDLKNVAPGGALTHSPVCEEVKKKQ